MQMMNEMIKRHGIQKRLAIVMALLMVLGLLPDSLLQVRAANEVVTITVKDENGAPVGGASVSYRISLGSAGSVTGDDAGLVSGYSTGSEISDSTESELGDSTESEISDSTESEISDRNE